MWWEWGCWWWWWGCDDDSDGDDEGNGGDDDMMIMMMKITTSMIWHLLSARDYSKDFWITSFNLYNSFMGWLIFLSQFCRLRIWDIEVWGTS